MVAKKTLGWLLYALASASASGWAADDLLTIQMVEEARLWHTKDRDDLAGEIWRKVLRANPKHSAALAELAAIEGRAGHSKLSESLLSRAVAATKQDASGKSGALPKQTPSKVSKSKESADESGALEVVIRDKPKAATRTEGKVGSTQTSSALPNEAISRRGLQKLAQENPGDPRYPLALARQLSSRESTRREGIREFNALTSRGQGTADSRSAWRRALLALRAGPQDITLFTDYLQKFPDEPAVLKRLLSLGGAMPKEVAVAVVVPAAPAPVLSKQAKALALLESGRAQVKVGDVDSLARARAQLEAGMLLDPANATIRLELARVYQALGLLDRSASLADSVLDSQPDGPEPLYLRALLYAAEQNWSNGLDLLERIPVSARTTEHAKTQQKIWVTVQVQRARQLFGVGNYKKASELLEQAQDAARQDPTLVTLVADGWSEIGQPTKALPLLRAMMNTTALQPAAVRLQYAEVLLNSRQDAELLALLKDLSSPGSLPADQKNLLNAIILGYTLRVSETLRESGRFADAAEVLNPALQRIDDIRLLVTMARVYLSAGNLDAAMELVERAVVREPTELSHRLLAFEIALIGNDLERARAYAQFALELASNHPRALTAMGQVEKVQGNQAKAAEYFRKSLIQESKKDEFPIAVGPLAVRLVSDATATTLPLGNRSEAGQGGGSSLLPIPILEARKAAVSSDSSLRIPTNGMQNGHVFLAEGDLVSAAASFSDALKFNPADAVALNNLAVVKVASGDFMAALALFAQSNKVAPQRVDIQDNFFQLQAWVRIFTGVKKASMGGFDPYIAAPPKLWSELDAAMPRTVPTTPMNSDCKIKPCK